MKASSWWPTLPAGPTPEREAAILEAVKAGHFLPITWCPVEVTLGQIHALIGVSSDAVRLGEPGDAWRIPVTPLGAQRIADELSVNHGIRCVLPTAMLDDLAWNKRVTDLAPHPMTQTDALVKIMGTTAQSIAHSRWIDDQLRGKSHEEGFLVRNVGKIWANTPALWIRDDGATRGANYGWHYRTAQPKTSPAATTFGGYTIQPLAFAHGADHTDYSQTLTLVAEDVILTNHATGEQGTVSICALALDNELCKLVSHEGPLPLRHPGVGCISGEGGAKPPGCPVPWTPPKGGPPPIASLEPWKRWIPVAVLGTAIGVATAVAVTAKA